MKLSLVIPCYNEQDNVELFYNTATEVFKDKGFDYELIFVNDGSRDQTMDKLRHIYEIADENVKVVGFSRNFGKESAIYAGLKESRGEMVCLIDADMQQRPELVLDMMAILDKDPNYDAVACYQEDRRESKVLSAFKDCFYKIINKMSSTEIVDGARDFRLMKRKMVDAILKDAEYNRFTKGIYSWVGFHTKWIAFENVERSAGETKWSFWKLFLYSIEGILAYSTAPLAVASVFGIVFCGVSFISMLVIIIRALAFGDPVAGWPSLVTIIFFLGGIQLLCLGIMGLYLSKTYLETKKRPIYIVRESE